jgi:hypothetical protein
MGAAADPPDPRAPAWCPRAALGVRFPGLPVVPGGDVTDVGSDRREGSGAARAAPCPTVPAMSEGWTSARSWSARRRCVGLFDTEILVTRGRGHDSEVAGRAAGEGGVAMTTRLTFKPEFLHAIQIRGLTLTELAKVSPATVSAAVRGRPVNIRTATLLCRAVSSRPVLPELETWAAEVSPGKPSAEVLLRH